MKADLKTRHGGKILADALLAQGVKMAFGVPGESYLPLLDGLHDARERLSFVVCRQEGGASYMAEAYGKLTGEPGVLLVTRGPGATNGSIGVHTGFQDSTPMVMFIGQVGNDMVEREAFQEIDYRRMYGQMGSGGADRPRRAHPEHEPRVPHGAAGRPGPVVLRCRRTVRGGGGRRRAAPPHRASSRIGFGNAKGGGASLAGTTPLRHRRRGRLERRGLPQAPALDRENRPAGRHVVPLPGSLRQPQSQLRGRRRHRHQPEACPE
jgi:hypothetical protein